MEKFWISLCTNPPEEGQRECRGSSSCIFLPRFHSACSVLQEFSAEERDPVKITEGWGVMFTCSPPPHYPGKGDTGEHRAPRFFGNFMEVNIGLIQSLQRNKAETGLGVSMQGPIPARNPTGSIPLGRTNLSSLFLSFSPQVYPIGGS